MSKIKTLLKKDVILVVASVALLVLSILPLIVIGKYNVMSADDYSVGKLSNKIWAETHSVAEMFRYAIRHTVDWYLTWQGSYSTVFCNNWNPGFFGEHLVWITPCIMIFSILLSLYVFVKSVVGKLSDACNKECLMIWAGVCFLTLQTMPSPVEGLYWYPGAITYLLIQTHMLIFIALCISLEDKKGILKVIGVPVAFFLAFWVGGSYYITVLQCVLWYTVYLVLNYKKMNWWKIVTGVFLLAGFWLNVAAPGNSVRRENAGGMSAVMAILQSFLKAFKYGKKWISPLLVCIILFLIPVIWRVFSKVKREFRFRYPLLVTAFSYCIFSAAFTPPLYGVGNVDSGRIQNSIQGFFYIIVVANVFYYIGWLQYKIKCSEKDIYRDIGTIKSILAKYRTIYQWLTFGLIVLVFVGTGDKNTFSSMSALRSLVTGEAQTYYAEAQERLEIYRDESNPVAEIEAFSVKPKVLYFTDVVPEGDINYWINENIAEYYGKEKVILKDSAE